MIGDRVWIGQESLILKGTKLGSGSILGGHTVISNKNIKSNSLYAGNPAKKIKDNVFYGDFKSTHDFDLQAELDSEYNDTDKYVYEKYDTTIFLEDIDDSLKNIKFINGKIDFIEKMLVNNNNKNRFYR